MYHPARGPNTSDLLTAYCRPSPCSRITASQWDWPRSVFGQESKLHLAAGFTGRGVAAVLLMMGCTVHKDQHGAELFVNLEQEIPCFFPISGTIKVKTMRSVLSHISHYDDLLPPICSWWVLTGFSPSTWFWARSSTACGPRPALGRCTSYCPRMQTYYELFLNASRSSSVADLGLRGLGTTGLYSSLRISCHMESSW